jgi:hypothetical protein
VHSSSRGIIRRLLEKIIGRQRVRFKRCEALEVAIRCLPCSTCYWEDMIARKVETKIRSTLDVATTRLCRLRYPNLLDAARRGILGI